MKLYNYIAERSGEGRANGYIDRTQEFCQSIGMFPVRGVRRGDLKKGPRVIGFERRVAIAFRGSSSEVIVARVLYGARGLARLSGSHVGRIELP